MENSIIQTDQEYKKLIVELKRKVATSRFRAALTVNAELIKLYWEIGKLIIQRHQHTKWGGKLLEQISSDLRSSYPDMRGFSRTNIHNMKRFAENFPDFQIVQQTVGQIPWGHIIVLIQSVSDERARSWYLEQTMAEGWARNALIRAIKSDLYTRQGQLQHKTTNFDQRLPAPQSDLAHELIKEPYDFCFLPLSSGAKEREIELGLIGNVRDFLLELGSGFAYIGNQFPLEVAGEDYYLDLLFFNIPLNAYFVIELKTGKFKPEYAGKLNFYLSVVDDLLKQPHHNETIGLMLCEDKNKIIAEYALRRTQSPMGISEYQLSKTVPEQLKKTLPSTNLLEQRLSQQEKLTA